MKTKFVERMSARINTVSQEEARKLSKVLFRYMLYCGRVGDVSTLNALIGKIEGSASPWIISGLLRGSLRYFHHLNNWIGLRDRFIEHAKKIGDDPNSLLIGLLTMDGYDPPATLDFMLQVHHNFRK